MPRAKKTNPAPLGANLWRLPFGVRLHASRDCRLLALERTLPSPRDWEISLIQSATNRRVSNAPQEETWRDLTPAIPRLCSCAAHLRNSTARQR